MTDRGRLLAAAALAAFLGPRCVTLERPSRTRVELTGAGADAVYTDRDCEGQIVHTERHRQLGGRVDVIHESSLGVDFGAHAEALEARRKQASDDSAAYRGASGGLSAAFDSDWLGFAGGARLATLGEHSGLFLPWVAGWGGARDVARGELTVGRRDGLLDGRVLSLGAAYTPVIHEASSQLEVRTGVAWVSRPMILQTEDPGRRVNGAQGPNWDSSLYVSARWVWDGGVGAHGGATLGASPSAHLGLVLVPEAWFSE